MCVALPAKIVEKTDDDGWVLLGDTRMRVNLVLTPEARVGEYVLVHAGFALSTVTDEDARETFRVYDAVHGDAEDMP